MGRIYSRPWVLGHWDALALWGQWLFAHLICLRVCVMRCFGIVRTIPTSSSWSTDQTFDLGLCFLLRQRMSLFFDNFDHRLQGQHCPSATLLYIVDWLVQWSKDYSDTTVFGWPTLRMSNRMSYFYIEVWSCEMLSLCGKLIWRWNVVFRLHFVFRRRLYRIPYVNHFVLEKRRLHERYSVASWLFTFENQFALRTFGSVSIFLNSPSEKWICRFVAAGIVSTNLYLKNLRFVNWKPRIEFYQLRHRLKGVVSEVHLMNKSCCVT